MRSFVIRLIVRAVNCRRQTTACPTAWCLCIHQANSIVRAATVAHLTRTVKQRTVIGNGRQSVHTMIAEDRNGNRWHTIVRMIHRFDALTKSRREEFKHY